MGRSQFEGWLPHVLSFPYWVDPAVLSQTCTAREAVRATERICVNSSHPLVCSGDRRAIATRIVPSLTLASILSHDYPRARTLAAG